MIGNLCPPSDLPSISFTPGVHLQDPLSLRRIRLNQMLLLNDKLIMAVVSLELDFPFHELD